jgi:hypothetical protein
MIEYGKLINGILQPAPNKIKTDEGTIYNPPGETLQSLGYLPLHYTDVPEVDEDHYLSCSWSEINNELVQEWHINEAQPTVEDILNVLMGEE